MSVLFLSDIGETISTIGEKLVPNLLSFVVQFLSFIILLLVVFFLAYKPVKRLLNKRADYIEEEVRQAKENNDLAAASVDEAKELVNASKIKASEIVKNAEAQGQEKFDAMILEAKAEVAQMKKDAEEDIARAKEDAIQDIFLSMHKDTKVKQNINCESCGYRSCKDMATAIANGYARIQDCVYYMNDDLRFAALKDRMTGIYNSVGFRKKAREMLKDNPSGKYRVYVGNVNKLKSVNDLYGSESGDKVLCYIAKRLSDFVEGKGLCARFGGGVFSVFLEDKEEYIKEFSTLFTSDVRHLGIDFPITIRYGFYKIDDNSMDIGSVTNLCTYAADMATDRTQNTFVEFTDSMKNEMKIETDITLNMKGAMEKGEFVLFMQPQYNHKSGKIVGAEALSRWKKPDGSLVSPGVFIPVFEKNGFIKALDKYVWESVFKLVSEWEKSDVLHVPVSVNISRISLETDDIVDTIAVLSKKYPINKNNLYFEITESAYMKNQDEIVDRVTRIRNLGYKIAMDDFGSGYSSLNSLKDIPLDVLKLDMGFLRGGTNVERGNNIIAYMVDMAKALQLKIVAEGVETKEQADFLTERGCDVIQGFYYAKPMPLFDYEEKLSEK